MCTVSTKIRTTLEKNRNSLFGGKGGVWNHFPLFSSKIIFNQHEKEAIELPPWHKRKKSPRHKKLCRFCRAVPVCASVCQFVVICAGYRFVLFYLILPTCAAQKFVPVFDNSQDKAHEVDGSARCASPLWMLVLCGLLL